MIFGQSVFQSVLNRLKDEDTNEDDETDAVTGFHVRGLSSGFVVERSGTDGSADAHRATTSYLDIIASAPQPQPPPPVEETMPDHLTRTAPEDIAADLDISARETVATLTEKRRRFAKLNHPDGVSPAFRDNATIRMKIANLLIDEALRRLDH